MEYALMENGIVSNIICLHPMNANDFLQAIPFDGLPVQIGDTYDGKNFYHNGKKVVAIDVSMTEAQVAAIKDMAIAEIEEAVINGIDE